MKYFSAARPTKYRAMGLRRFILMKGVFGFGVFLAIYIVGTTWVITTFSSFGARIAAEIWPKTLALAAAAVLVLGPALAVVTWFLSERLSRRTTSHSPEPPEQAKAAGRPRTLRVALFGLLSVIAILAPLAWNWNRTSGCVDWAKRLGRAEAELAKFGDSTDRFFTLADASKSAAEVGEVAKARRYATELLDLAVCFRKNWNYGNTLHDGHMVLGRVAFASGDIATAKQELLEAGRTPGSPQLDSFGPNMALALDLLRKGERETVRKYFSECANFWQLGRGQLRNWATLTKFGITPDFGANLLY